MMISKTDKNIEELFESLLQRDLEEKTRGSQFVFDSVNLLHYEFHKVSLNRVGSHINSIKWLKNKKVTINPENNDDSAFNILSLEH